MSLDLTYPELIAIDWGTTNLRAFALGPSGKILRQLSQPRGVLTLARNDYRGIASAIVHELAPALPEVPVLLAGMVGSNRGWVEAPYVECPAFLDQLAEGLVEVEGLDNPAFLVPGVCSAEDDDPDIMRGEETQIIGALEILGERLIMPANLCLPGTHTKWAMADEGGIVSFRTTLSGELYDLLLRHSILAQTLGSGTPAPFDPIAFEDGSNMASGGMFLTGLFSVRAHAVLRKMTPAYAQNFVSGLIIGTDASEGVDFESEDPVVMIAPEETVQRYEIALKAYDTGVIAVDAAHAFTQGAMAIAAAAGLVGEMEDEDGDLEEDE